ncbi:hypothetical protein HanPI659440_Chr16g0619781 [Helianthus annuus]|nr:hypothetical protein HanPI659440_Chr16g0619781 [Helianthus annuus]
MTFFCSIFVPQFTSTKKKKTTITTITQISKLMIPTTNLTVPIAHPVHRLDEVKSMTNLTNVFQTWWKLCTKFMNIVITTMTTRVVIPMIPVDFFPTSGTQTLKVLVCN